jgi:hypothetical protein
MKPTEPPRIGTPAERSVAPVGAYAASRRGRKSLAALGGWAASRRAQSAAPLRAEEANAMKPTEPPRIGTPAERSVAKSLAERSAITRGGGECNEADGAL